MQPPTGIIRNGMTTPIADGARANDSYREVPPPCLPTTQTDRQLSIRLAPLRPCRRRLLFPSLATTPSHQPSECPSCKLSVRPSIRPSTHQHNPLPTSPTTPLHSNPSIMAYLDQALTIIFLVYHILWWPVSRLIASLIFLLAPFYRVTVFLLLPFNHAGHVLINVLSFPFTVKWLERIETLYVYLGTAALIGSITGGILYTIMRVLSSILNIDASAMPKPRQKSRTVAEYRATKAVNKEDVFDQTPAIPPVIIKKVPEFRRRKGLLSSAIIEEEDSDF
ncbi:hypothetical protein J1614_005172 [Plenodomus biglobosus]|nr:hypothetical protein J1614_005172 [Plenodomus biglobosus]